MQLNLFAERCWSTGLKIVPDAIQRLYELYKSNMRTKKELKQEYEEMKFKMGVFQIRNMLNSKVFIGSSLDLKAIWHAQKLQLDMGMHQNNDLQKDWNLYGPENFIYEILEEIQGYDDKPIDYKKEIKALELLIIEEVKPFGIKGYNREPKNPVL